MKMVDNTNMSQIYISKHDGKHNSCSKGLRIYLNDLKNAKLIEHPINIIEKSPKLAIRKCQRKQKIFFHSHETYTPPPQKKKKKNWTEKKKIIYRSGPSITWTTL